MKAKKLVVLASVAYAATLATLGSVTDAKAASRRLHASGICHETLPSYSANVQHLNTLRSLGAATGTLWINCAVPSDSTLAHNAVTSLNIHGYEPTGSSIYSQACSKAYNSAAQSCGAISNWGSGYGGAGISDLSAWSVSSSFPYILTNLRDGELFGYYIGN